MVSKSCQGVCQDPTDPADHGGFATVDVMATQVERRNATRGAILRASIAAFEGGDLSASLESIAASAGVTKGSIHYHFTSRTGLLEAVASHTFTEIEKRIAARADAVEVETWVREVLEDQVSPRGRMLYAIADELARVGSLVGSDPFPYISLRLSEFDIAAPPTVVAAALIQYGRQLAYGSTPKDAIDGIMADLSDLL